MFGERLKTIRAKNGISQATLATKLSVAQPTVASWEINRTSPPPEIITQLAKYFNVTTDYLLGNSPNPDPLPPDTATALKKVAELEAALAAERAEKAQILAESTEKDKIIANVKTALNIAETKSAAAQAVLEKDKQIDDLLQGTFSHLSTKQPISSQA